MELSAGIKAWLFWHSLSSHLRARSHRFGSLHSMVIKWPCNISFFFSFLPFPPGFVFWVHSEITTTRPLAKITKCCPIYWLDIGWKKGWDEKKEVDAEVHRRSSLGESTEKVIAGSCKMHHPSLTWLLLVLKEEIGAISCHHLYLDHVSRRPSLLQRVCPNKCILGFFSWLKTNKLNSNSPFNYHHTLIHVTGTTVAKWPSWQETELLGQ